MASASSWMALCIGQGLVAAALPLLAAPLAVVGLLDDRHNLPASWRFGVQLLTAALILGFSPLVQRFDLAVASGSLLFLPVLVLLAIAVTSVITSPTSWTDSMAW